VSVVQDVALKLLLDAARGLAYMHDVDVVHGDVKSRNLLVFWEDDEDAASAADSGAAEAAGTAVNGADGTAADAAAAQPIGEEQQRESGEQRELVWALKWCDFGVSFRAAEAPDGILRTVSSALQCVAVR
jgi:serine/threonine protein kinase